MSKGKDVVSKERWAALKAKPSAAINYTHVSARAWMEPNKKDHLLPSKPRVEHGQTYNAGRNAAKLQRRSQRGS